MSLKIPKSAKGKQSVAHVRSPKQESELAKRYGGKLTVGSGNQYDKGDVKNCEGFICIEAKCTGKLSFSVTRDMFHKIEEASMGRGETPCIVIEFLDDRGNVDCELAVLPVYALHSLKYLE